MKRFMKIMLLMGLVVSIAACTKLTDMNINPNDPTSTDPNYLFTYALQQGMGNYNSDVNLEQWGLMNWTMFMAARGGVEPGKEYVIPSGKDDFWREQYSQAISNSQVIINMVDENPELVNLKAAATIWKINCFHRITDLWGNSPYSEAILGMTELNYAPTYDVQQDIYHNMLDQLKMAVESFSNEEFFFSPNADLVYEGDLEKWKTLGNSLRFRLAIRISKADPQKYQEVIQELKSARLMTSNEESALFPFNSIAKNHLYEVMSRGEAIVQNNPSKFMVDLLVNTNDPRSPVFLEKAPLSFLPIYADYKGVPNLVLANDPVWENYNPDGEWGDVSRIGNWFLRNETPGVVMSYSELCFLKAEAVLNGHWEGSASDFMEEGIRSNIQFYMDYGDGTDTISEAAMNAYIASLGETNLEEIITQKWITFIFENGYEAYSEYRRTGFPVLTNFDGEAIDNEIFPKRMIYPYSEFTLNRDNYNESVNQQGQDNEFTKIWWNK